MITLKADVLSVTGITQSAVIDIGDDGRIAAISRGTDSSADYDFSGRLIVPGFVDLHVHGGGGFDFMNGTTEAVRAIARLHARYGTTSLLATTLTAERQDVDKAIRAVVEVMDNPGDDEANIRGIHLEGPYICSKRRGAQPEAPIRKPDINEFRHWLALSGHRIKQITLAPEVEGALEFIEFAVSQGVTVSIGHTDATSAEASRGIEAGARQGTHLYNAMSQLGHRSPGTVGALLADDRVYCELICDGFHIDPVAVRVAVLCKSPNHVLLITDAMAGTSMPDGNYSLGGRTVIVDGGSARFADGTLAGSVLTMNMAFRNVMQYAAVSVAQASLMASTNAAAVIGAATSIGTIEVGKIADLAILDPETGVVAGTVVAGRFVGINR